MCKNWSVGCTSSVRLYTLNCYKYAIAKYYSMRSHLYVNVCTVIRVGRVFSLLCVIHL